MLRLPTRSCLFLLGLLPTLVPAADDWPSWRGPTGDGLAAADASPPLTWGEEENVLWAIELPGLGNSSPVIRDGRIYLTAAIDLEAVPEGEAPGAQPGPTNAEHLHRFVVLALDQETGEELWRTAVAEAMPHESVHTTSSHASASIQLDGERVIAFFGSRGLHGLTPEGRLVWSRELGSMETLMAFGEGSTPAVHEGTVVVQWDEEGQSFVAAFDSKTGEERWREPREVDSSWGSPVIAEVDGDALAILTGSDETRAYDVETGEVVWACPGMSKNPVNSPLIAGGVLYVMNSYRGKIIQAIDLERAAGEVGSETGLLWSKGQDAPYVPMPIVVEGLLYYLRDSTGVLTCLDARTGEKVYGGKRLESVKRIHASPVSAAGRIYFTSREGQTVVVRAGKEFEILAVNELDDVFDATPAIVGSSIYLRGRSRLYRLGEPED